MANEAVQKFLDMIKSDTVLRDELEKEMLSSSSSDSALVKASALAMGRGLNVSVADLRSELPSLALPTGSASGELSGAQLDAVSGGLMNWAKACIGSTSIYCYICTMGTTGA